MELVRADLAERGGRSVVISHCFAAGVEPTPRRRARHPAGGLDLVPLAVFDGPDYVALGHIHGRQQLIERVRYSGAPLHYSFGEATSRAAPGSSSSTPPAWHRSSGSTCRFRAGSSTLTGTLDELLTDAAHEHTEEDWVCAVLTDQSPPARADAPLQTRFPRCASSQHRPAASSRRRRRQLRRPGARRDQRLARSSAGSSSTCATAWARASARRAARSSDVLARARRIAEAHGMRITPPRDRGLRAVQDRAARRLRRLRRRRHLPDRRQDGRGQVEHPRRDLLRPLRRRAALRRTARSGCAATTAAPDDPDPVALEFTSGDRRYRVERVARVRAAQEERAAARRQSPAEALLDEWVGGEWVGIAARPRDVGPRARTRSSGSTSSSSCR